MQRTRRLVGLSCVTATLPICVNEGPILCSRKDAKVAEKSNPLLSRNHFFAMEGRACSVCQLSDAFDTGGKLKHAGEDLQLAEMVLFRFDIETACHHPVKLVEQFLGFVFGFPLHDLRHHRRRRLRYRTARSFERNVLYRVALEIDVHTQRIAAQRIISVRRPVSFDLAKVPRVLVVLENRFP